MANISQCTPDNRDNYLEQRNMTLNYRINETGWTQAMNRNDLNVIETNDDDGLNQLKNLLHP